MTQMLNRDKVFIFKKDYESEVSVIHNFDGSADVESKGYIFEKGDLIQAESINKESATVIDDKGEEMQVPTPYLKKFESNYDVKEDDLVIPSKSSSSDPTPNLSSPKSVKKVESSSYSAKKIAISVGLILFIYLIATRMQKVN